MKLKFRWHLAGLLIGFAAGAVVLFFVIRNNRKAFNAKLDQAEKRYKSLEELVEFYRKGGR